MHGLKNMTSSKEKMVPKKRLRELKQSIKKLVRGFCHLCSISFDI